MRREVVRQLEGGETLGLSAPLWGEQVILYVRFPELANPACIPGVSRTIPRGDTRVRQRTAAASAAVARSATRPSIAARRSPASRTRSTAEG